MTGFDYGKTFSPVIKPGIIQLILTLVLSQKWSLKQLDICNTFLHGDLYEQVYLSQLLDFEDTKYPEHVCHLHKALYGLKQASRACYTKFSSHL